MPHQHRSSPISDTEPSSYVRHSRLRKQGSEKFVTALVFVISGIILFFTPFVAFAVEHPGAFLIWMGTVIALFGLALRDEWT